MAYGRGSFGHRLRSRARAAGDHGEEDRTDACRQASRRRPATAGTPATAHQAGRGAGRGGDSRRRRRRQGDLPRGRGQARRGRDVALQLRAGQAGAGVRHGRGSRRRTPSPRADRRLARRHAPGSPASSALCCTVIRGSSRKARILQPLGPTVLAPIEWALGVLEPTGLPAPERLETIALFNWFVGNVVRGELAARAAPPPDPAAAVAQATQLGELLATGRYPRFAAAVAQSRPPDPDAPLLRPPPRPHPRRPDRGQDGGGRRIIRYGRRHECR